MIPYYGTGTVLSNNHTTVGGGTGYIRTPSVIGGLRVKIKNNVVLHVRRSNRAAAYTIHR